MDGQAISVKEMSTYIVEAIAGQNGLMVKDDTGANFFFRPDSGTLVNIVPLVFVAVSSILFMTADIFQNRSTDLEDPNRKVVVTSFKNESVRMK